MAILKIFCSWNTKFENHPPSDLWISDPFNVEIYVYKCEVLYYKHHILEKVLDIKD